MFCHRYYLRSNESLVAVLCVLRPLIVAIESGSFYFRSDVKSISLGVPQGCVLGPMTFVSISKGRHNHPPNSLSSRMWCVTRSKMVNHILLHSVKHFIWDLLEIKQYYYHRSETKWCILIKCQIWWTYHCESLISILYYIIFIFRKLKII